MGEYESMRLEVVEQSCINVVPLVSSEGFSSVMGTFPGHYIPLYVVTSVDLQCSQ